LEGSCRQHSYSARREFTDASDSLSSSVALSSSVSMSAAATAAAAGGAAGAGKKGVGFTDNDSANGGACARSKFTRRRISNWYENSESAASRAIL
jgi:hypothetical protein